MAAIIYQTDRRSGITYAYESISYWDKDKQQSRAKRHMIGRVDKENGEIIPTRKKKSNTDTVNIKQGSLPITDVKRRFYGATYLFDSIGESLGITEDLKQCFPDTYKQILSVVYYLILEDNNPLSRFSKWSVLHRHPWDKDISSQRSSELFASITEVSKDKFFRLQGKRRIEKEFWAYDTTSVSSFSETLRQVQYGNNKDNDPLPQLNIALLFGEKSNLPFYYRKLAGNIPDSKTVRNLIADLDVLGYNKIKLVMDRGFYSEANINGLYQSHLKFLIAVRMSLAFVKKGLDTIYDDFRTFENYCEKYEIYTTTLPVDWQYTQERPYKGDSIKENRRMYLHLYFNIDKAAEDEKVFDKNLCALRNELESEKRVSEHENQYTKYFDIKTTPKRGTQVAVKQNVVREAKRYYGYFALISNETMDSVIALEIYRNKDVVEKAFGNLKERLNMKRMLVSSEQSLDGKLFVEFVALIYLSYIKKQMQDHDLFKSYTLQGVLDKLDVIECFEQPGRKLRVGELLEKQKDLYNYLGIISPSSLC